MNMLRQVMTGLLSTLLLFTTAGGAEPPAGVPVGFTLDRPGYVTLVIEDEQGRRINNLINDTFFEAGDHTIYWDGYDVGDKQGREENFEVRRHLAEPGTYRARGIVHDDVKLRYRASAQSPGTPPWKTGAGDGGWLADHTPPQSAMFLPAGTPADPRPQVVMTASVAEAGHCIMWLDTTGEKLFGSRFVGWRGPCVMAIDRGPEPDSDYYMYAGVFNRGPFELYGLPNDPDNWYGKQKLHSHQVDTDNFTEQRRWELTKTGLAVWNGVIAYHPPADRHIYFRKGKQNLGAVRLDDPRGMTMDEQGRLYVIDGKQVVRYDRPDFEKGQLGEQVAIVVDGNLVDPRRITLDGDGNLYVADWGDSQQVKVFSPRGRMLRAIGKPSDQIQHGRYDERKMWHPAGLAVDQEGKLWVAELNYAPKRISVWDAATGEFQRAYYGPPKYGGGGHLDPKNPDRFFYSSGMQGVEFVIDPETNISRPRSIYWHTDYNMARCPDSPIYRGGRMYMTDNFYGPAYFLAQDAAVYLYDEETATVQCVARVGAASRKGIKGRFLDQYMEQDPELKAKLEAGWGDAHWKSQFAVWSDLNLDGKPQADEVQGVSFSGDGMKRTQCGVTFDRDLAIATTSGVQIPAPTFTDRGVPVWDLDAWEAAAARNEHLSNIVPGPGGFFIFASGGHSQARVARGYKDGELVWKINGVNNARPQQTGQLAEPRRNIGFPVTPAGQGGPMFALNGYHGQIPVVTTDGLYVTELLGDARVVPRMSAPEARRGMIVDDVTFGEEHFWPAVDQMADGTVYLIAGHPSSNLFEVIGLDTVERIGPWPVTLTAEIIAGKDEVKIEPEHPEVQPTAVATISPEPPTLDGSLEEWTDADWVTLNRQRGYEAAVRVSGDVLYAAWRTGEPNLLNNDVAEGADFAFVTGGGLDLMLRTDPSIEQPGFRKRLQTDTAAEGDVRIFITRKGEPRRGPVLAVRYQQVGGPGPGRHYDSPVGEVHFDSVRDVSDRVRLARQGGSFEVAVPLDVIGLKVKPGMETIANLGVITGNGAEATARYYWSKRVSTMVADIPTEAALQPQGWNTLHFEAAR